MFDNSIDYSPNTPVFYNTSILDKKIIELINNNNMKGGNGNNNLPTSNYISMIMGIIIIIIGFILLWLKNDLVELEATILNKTRTNIVNNNECKIYIKYIVNSTQYSKIITINKNNISNDSTIKIYYHQSDPNSIQLINPNYYVIGIGSIIVGSFIIIFSLFDNFDSNSLIESTTLPISKQNQIPISKQNQISISKSNSKENPISNIQKNIYPISTNSNGYSVVYKTD